MAKPSYGASSPYKDTTFFNSFLDVWAPRTFEFQSDDILYEIDAVYAWRPDLLASDTYGDPSLWWVFSIRNPNSLKDPIFDFVEGTRIYLPKLDTLKKDLGI